LNIFGCRIIVNVKK